MTETQTLTQPAIPYDRLPASLDGRLISPESDEYDATRQLFIGGTDPTPAAIARAADAEDVSRVVSFARDRGVALRVRSGGHTDFGSRTANVGLLLDIRDLRSLEIDDAARTAWAGARWTDEGL